MTNPGPITQALATSKHLYQQIMHDHENFLTDIFNKLCDEHGIPEEDRPTIHYTPFNPDTGSPSIEVTYKDKPEDA